MYASRVMNSHILDPIDFMGQETDNKSIKTFDVINKFKKIPKDEKMSILVGQVPEYSMYFKMLKMGIPKDAIKQKMSLSGVESKVLDYPETAPYITVLHYISNPHLDQSELYAYALARFARDHECLASLHALDDRSDQDGARPYPIHQNG